MSMVQTTARELYDKQLDKLLNHVRDKRIVGKSDVEMDAYMSKYVDIKDKIYEMGLHDLYMTKPEIQKDIGMILTKANKLDKIEGKRTVFGGKS